jgi:hypothetical protein
MSAFQVEPVTDVPVEAGLSEPIVTVGMLSPQAYAVAAMTSPAFSVYSDYEDWRDAREGRRMSLAFAGVDAELTQVSLTALIAWSSLTGIEPDEVALDSLAAFSRALRLAPNAVALATTTRRDFDACADRRDALCGARDFDAWLRRRSVRQAELTAAGDGAFDIPLRFADVVAWCDCLGLPVCEASLDAYAALMLELLAAE